MTDIFISYSHKDEAWKEALQRHLKVLQSHNAFAIWDDRQIEVGSNWLPAIEDAIEKAKVALLLVSSDFLTSDFVSRKEIPRFLQRREAEGLQVVPVIVHPCAWQAVPWLAALQGGTRDNRPLAQFPLGSFESEQAFSEITLKVYNLLQAAKQEEESKRLAEIARIAEQQRLEQERLQRELEQARLAKEQAEHETVERARQSELQRQHELAEQAKRDRLEREQAAAAERAKAEQVKREQAAVEKAEQERLAQEQAELKRLERERQKAENGHSDSGTKAKWLWGGIGTSALVGAIVWVMPGKQPDPPKRSVADPAPVVDTTPTPEKVAEPIKPASPLPEMVSIKGGPFEMGCKAGRDDVEDGCEENEKLLHPVQVADFALSRTEVTRGQFRAFVEASGYKTTAEQDGSCYGDKTGKGDWGYVAGNSWRNPGFEQTDEHPVVCVSWNDAQAYVTWLNEADAGKQYRLPSEAEWEYAARGGNQQNAYPWGQEGSGKLACQGANLADQNLKSHYPNWQEPIANCKDGYIYTAPVGQFSTNAYGLLDMHGNVWEWTQDCYHDSYKDAPKTSSAWEEKSCVRRVLRGGSWNFRPRFLRSADRGGDVPPVRNDNIGFRISRTD